MKAIALCLALMTAALAPAAHADGPRPGRVVTVTLVRWPYT